MWGELRRRNVFKVAVAYAIVAWLLIEMTATVFPALKLPEWTVTFVTALILISFPVILIGAWAFEVTPDGLKRTREVPLEHSITHVTGRKFDFAIIGLLAIAVVFLIVDNYVLVDEPAPAVSEQSELAVQPVEKSIAVLPFVNMSSDPEQEFFSDGLSEEILNLLAKIRGLKVIGRTSSFAFKGRNEDLRGIGQALGVKTVLEGSVRKSGERVRITAQLIDVSDGAHIWSETYNRTMTDIFAVQDDVAAAIIDALQIHVGTNPTRGRPTESTEAYTLFLKARASFDSSAVINTEELLLQAVELDPKFAEAYELLAYCYWILCGTGTTVAEGQKLTGDAAAKALALDPDLVFAQALYQSGNVENYSYLGEIEAFERAMRQQPGNSALMDALAWDLVEAGYLQEALEVAERLVELEPLSPLVNFNLAIALYAVGRTNESLAALDLTLQLGHDFVTWAIGNVNLVEKQDDVAIAHFEAFLKQRGLPSNWVRELVTAARDPATGQASLDRRIPQIVASTPEEYAYMMQGNLTVWYLLFGFLDRHFELIVDLEPTDSTWSDAEIPVYNATVFRRLGFTAHPRYLEVIEPIGTIELWEQRGPPDFCEKVDGEWVCE
jgi:TolB-like protein/predicted negative regulator of RcsB-dependent stress response